MSSTEKKVENLFLEQTKIQFPVICGAMYPCSNPELVAAVSEAGGIGIIQPISLTYVAGYSYREGLKKIKSLTSKPVGVNLLVEKISKRYDSRLQEWLELSLEAGIQFYITALGNPKWVVDRVKKNGGFIYHDVTEKKWALKALDAGVDGLICVNNRAGGHTGTLSPERLFESLAPLGKPLICAGGIGDEKTAKAMIDLGYQGIQLGTRFIATKECNAHEDYKKAILKASEKDIVLTEKISGVPVAVIKTDYIERIGVKAGWLAKKLLKNNRTKRWMRAFYTLQSLWQLKKASQKGFSYKDYWQAGKSVEGIQEIESAASIVQRFGQAILKSV